MTTINLSLVSHTNTGKTTLARSLLSKDVGEIRDEAHVTVVAERYTMIRTPAGDTLDLWDTPGFGDSVRLARRLRQQGNPIGWFLTQVWDRWRDRPLWSSQQALRNVRQDADVVLYLVNASEHPGDAGYVRPEMEILAWLGKPVLVLLNQLGEPRPGDADRVDENNWRRHLSPYTFVKGVLPLDAFARCWVQEFALLEAISHCLPDQLQSAFSSLQRAWREERESRFRAAMNVLGDLLVIARDDREKLDGPGVRSSLQRLGRAVGLAVSDPSEEAMQRLAGRLDQEIRRTTDQLIDLHGLAGRANEEIISRVASDYAARQRLGTGSAAAVGGVVSGALSGLAADLAVGGLTLGGGALVGAALGALGSAGAAQAVNKLRGIDSSTVGWSNESLQRLAGSALLRYLAVAHYGRGRGAWQQGEYPAHWAPLVDEELELQRNALAELFKLRCDDRNPSTSSSQHFAALLGQTASAILARLYPPTVP